MSTPEARIRGENIPQEYSERLEREHLTVCYDAFLPAPDGDNLYIAGIVPETELENMVSKENSRLLREWEIYRNQVQPHTVSILETSTKNVFQVGFPAFVYDYNGGVGQTLTEAIEDAFLNHDAAAEADVTGIENSRLAGS